MFLQALHIFVLITATIFNAGLALVFSVQTITDINVKERLKSLSIFAFSLACLAAIYWPH